MLAQPLSQCARRFFGLLRLRGPQCDYQLARIGEILLIELQPLDHGKIARQQIEYFHIESQPSQPRCNRHEQYEP